MIFPKIFLKIRPQVISRSENPPARSPECIFSKKNLTFLVVALKTNRTTTPFHSQNKTNKAVRYFNIFIFCSHYYRTKAIRRAEPGLEPGRWIFQPGHLNWRALV